MNATEIKLVRDSFAKVAPIAAQAAEMFYQRLFQTAPGLRALFKGPLEEQGEKLMGMLGTAVRLLDRPDQLVPTLEKLGVRHAGYDVKAEDYDSVGSAFLWTLEQGLGKAFTPRVRAAWTNAYGEIARIMKDAAATAQATAASRVKRALDLVETNVMVTDENYNIVYVNESLERMLAEAEPDLRGQLPHFQANGVVGTNIDSFHVNPAHQRNMLGALRSTHKTDLTIGGHVFELIVNPITGQGGERQGMVVEWKDVTAERVRLAREKKEALENTRIRNALDKCKTNLMIADDRNEIVYMNNSVTEMLRANESDLRKSLPNFDASSLIGQNIDVFHKNPAHQRGMLAGLRSTHSTSIKVGELHFDLVADPVVNDNGDRVGTVVEWRDRTADVKELAAIIAAAGDGDFSQRLSLEGKAGFDRQLATGINGMMEKTGACLDEVIRVLGALARGDLTERIVTDYKGAFGQLKDDSNRTVDSLTSIVQQIKESAETIDTASREISQGNTDLSQRTEEQASSLEETASSMEELTSTVKQNAENARQANQLAVGASDVASKGGNVVRDVVTTMTSISESSKKIADIISVIDGIAFQTNILALNAAVEAARAGEQGRGFAVVASEVRNLAQRSAAAAKEIKELITTSVGKVEAGTQLVDQAGRTMEEIVASVRRVTDIMAEITAASQEQSTGIEQVNQAITQMDEVTQQNAALVEQAAAASESLQEEAGNLVQAVAAFKLAQAEAAPVAVERRGPNRATNVARIAPRPAAARPAAARPTVAPTRRPAAPARAAAASAARDEDDWQEF